MAENSVIISSEEEAKLLKPIDEYVEEIQKKNTMHYVQTALTK